MKNFKGLRSQRGFSLVELMVVVAIIGVLAVIGIPQYQKFMSKARQAEAKSHLNGIFQGESAFFTEYNGYTTSMLAIGAGAVGIGLRYNAGFDLAACANYTMPGAPPNGAAGTNDIMTTTAGGATWYWNTPAAGVADPAAATTACDSIAAGQNYTAAAWGNPTNVQTGANNNGDVFTINNQRLIANTLIGI